MILKGSLVETFRGLADYYVPNTFEMIIVGSLVDNFGGWKFPNET